ncbi:MAG: ATP-binding cassette domain-containing protein [Desulfobacteraceae bacterium]|nr:ATP-binding cassette domain-containing protein [Desulfobacteraceae bacterium]
MLRKFINAKLEDKHREILKLIKEQRTRLIISMVCMVLVAASKAASAYLVKPVVDEIFINKDELMLSILPVALILIFFFQCFGLYGREYLLNYVGRHIIMQLRNQLYVRIQDLPVAFFQKEKTGTLMSRVTNDVNLVKDMVSSVVTGVFEYTFEIIFFLIVILIMDWQLALLTLVILPVAFFPVFTLGRKVRRLSSRNQENMAEITTFLHETFAGNKIVKAFSMEDYERRRFFLKTRRLFEIDLKAFKYKALNSPIMEFLGGVGVAMVVWFGGYKVINGLSTPGTFFAFMAAMVSFYGPVKKLSKLNNKIQEGLAGTDRIFYILETESEIKEIDEAAEIPHQPHRVVFENVKFKYNDNYILEGINIDVNPNEILALVGMSGGGKTSLVNLIPRFYDVSDGRICIDGVDIRDVTLRSLRDQIAIVTQEPILFNDTVRNNIAYGNQGATEAEIIQAAEAAFACEFIEGFPQGFNTNIGELGSRLSGGEKQRLCIARALLKNAPILILDEATSSLDTTAENLVQKALDNLMKDRTTFVIAHRLSTISYADRIIVLKNGRIVEEGGHEELLNLQGEYHKLYEMQFNNATPS